MQDPMEGVPFRSSLSRASQRGHLEVGSRFRRRELSVEKPSLSQMRSFQQAAQLSVYRKFTGQVGTHASDQGLRACWRKGALPLGCLKITVRAACDQPCQACNARRVPCDGMLPCSRCINRGSASACCYPNAKVDAPDPVLELPLANFRRTTLDERREMEEQLESTRSRLCTLEDSERKKERRGTTDLGVGTTRCAELRAEVAAREEELFQAFAMLSPQKIELDPERGRRLREHEREQRLQLRWRERERAAEAEGEMQSRRRRQLYSSPLALPMVTPAQHRREKLASRRRANRKGRKLPPALAASFKAGMGC